MDEFDVIIYFRIYLETFEFLSLSGEQLNQEEQKICVKNSYGVLQFVSLLFCVVLKLFLLLITINKHKKVVGKLGALNKVCKYRVSAFS